MKEPDSMSKHNPFKVPEDYFANFDDGIMRQIYAESKIPVKSKSIFKFYNVWPVAATLILTGIIIYFSKSTESMNRFSESGFSNLDSGELAIFENHAELDEEEFLEMLPEESIDSIYHYEMIQVSNDAIDKAIIEDIEEEFSILDEITNI